MRSKKLTGITLISLAIICIFMAPLGLAADGDGSGGGSEEGLALVSSSPASGQKDVSTSTSIDLEFTKNVVNMTVKDNNTLCFSLYQGQQKTAITVVMADDQIEPEKKRLVSIVPEEPLQPGTTYTLRISPALISKSGVSLGQEVAVSFTTAGNAVINDSSSANTSDATSVQEDASIKHDISKVSAEEDSNPEESISMEKDSSSQDPAEESEPNLVEEAASQSEVQEGNSEAENDGGDADYIWLIALVVVIASSGIYLYVRKHSSKR